jgi:hypothetical protein
MIGRGGANDIAVGGPSYLEAHDARRLSTEFGDWLDTANAHAALNLRIAHQSGDDAFCGGDDWPFARWGIPSVRVSTGRHADYHQVTDDVTHIDFDKYARVTQLIGAVAESVANRPARPVIDKGKPDSRRPCVR